MTAPADEALRQLALRVLAHYAGPAQGPEAVAAAVGRVFDDLARVVAPVIGDLGVESLMRRALHIARREYPWLAATGEPVQTDTSIAQLISRLKQQDAGVATGAAGAVVATFTGLLGTFIGENLTGRLLRKAWPDAFSGVSREEHRA